MAESKRIVILKKDYKDYKKGARVMLSEAEAARLAGQTPQAAIPVQDVIIATPAGEEIVRPLSIVKGFKGYNSGEICTFPLAEAKKLIKLGLAVDARFVAPSNFEEGLDFIENEKGVSIIEKEVKKESKKGNRKENAKSAGK